MRRLIFAALFCALVIPTMAHADTFDYTFTVVGGTGFTYDSPSLIVVDTKVTPLTCNSGTGSCLAIGIDPVSGEIEFFEASGSTTYSSLPASFFDVGTHTFGRETLTIADVPMASAPEPSGLLLLGTGLIGMFGVVRKELFLH